MNINNQKVAHKKFGEGIVSSHNEKYIVVSFDSVERKFQFPEAFKQFLVAKDSLVAERIATLLQEIADNESHSKLIDESKKVSEEKRKTRAREISILIDEFHNDMVAYHVMRKQRGYYAKEVENMLNELKG